MKKILIASVLLWLCTLGLHAQTYMYLDEPFKNTTKPMPVKRKGISTVGKYQFGPYGIIAGKAGWTTTKSSSNPYKGESKIESKSRSSFILTSNQRDSITVNITFTAMARIEDNNSFLFRILTGWVSPEVKENYEVYLASLSSTLDTSTWKLILSYPVGDEINRDISTTDLHAFHGLLSNERNTITIKPELRWEDGKQATLFKPVEGYTFQQDEETIAAVQVLPFNKMHAWIKSDVPDALKLTLAAGIATMLVRSEATHQ